MSSGACANNAAVDRHISSDAMAETTAWLTRTTLRALAPAGVGGNLRCDAAAGRVGQMQDAVDELQPLPRILGKTVEFGELRRIPDAGQRGGKMHGVRREQHRPNMGAHTVANAAGVADLRGS